MSELEPQCLLGHGVCPKTCDNHVIAQQVTGKIAQPVDPEMLRLRTVFADAFDPQINVTHVAEAFAGCEKEKSTTRPHKSV